MGLRPGYDDLPIGVRLLVRLVRAASPVAMGAGLVYAFRASVGIGVLAVLTVVALVVGWDYLFTCLAARSRGVPRPGLFDLDAREQARRRY